LWWVLARGAEEKKKEGGWGVGGFILYRGSFELYK